MSFCPGEAVLRLLGTDALDDSRYDAIEQHVEVCPSCQVVLERLAHPRGDGQIAQSGVDGWPHIPGFEIQSELGRGAMGVVYLATATGLDRPVALKVLPRGLGPDASTGPRRRWMREARAISSVRHPGIVPLHHFGETEECYYLVLEYIPGGTLKQRLAEPLPPRTAARLMETITRAVGCIHEHGLFHLDLKPSNILLDGEPDAPWDDVTPRVSDFGLAVSDVRRDGSETSLAGPRGTPSYMAPEQISGDRARIGAASDIHALGAILYELLTGRPPFQGASTLETLDQVRGQDPVRPRRLNPRIPRDLETISLECLEKNAAGRYRSAEALAADLRRYLDNRPIHARPVSAFEHARRWCGRQPVIASLAATLLLTVIGGFLGLLATLRHSQTMRARAEVNYQVASRSLDEILDLIYHEPDLSLYDRSHRDQRMKAIELARSQEVELSRRSPLDLRGLRRLAVLDQCLAELRNRSGRAAEARSLSEEAIHCWEACAVLAPDDREIQKELLSETGRMIMFLECCPGDRRFEHWEARAVATLQRLKSLPRAHVDAVSVLSHCHRTYAQSLLLRGHAERARQVLEADLDLIRSVPTAETASLTFGLSEARTLAALGRWSGEFTFHRSADAAQWGDLGADGLEQSLAELAALRAGWLPSIVTPPGGVLEGPTNEAWASRVVAMMQSDAAALDLDPARIPTIGWWMAHHGATTLAWRRKPDQLGEARRIVDQWLVLADRLAHAYRGQAAPFMMLSDGYVQRAKIAYCVDGEPAIEWERKALDAALRAVTLEPGNELAHALVHGRRARLRKLL